jgi:hypothetical protein
MIFRVDHSRRVEIPLPLTIDLVVVVELVVLVLGGLRDRGPRRAAPPCPPALRHSRHASLNGTLSPLTGMRRDTHQTEAARAGLPYGAIGRRAGITAD